MMIYLMAMGIRLIEMKRILKPTGSVYLHCDPTASHYLKIVMDSLFGVQRFRNEIVWCYRGGGVPKSDFQGNTTLFLGILKRKTWFSMLMTLESLIHKKPKRDSGIERGLLGRAEFMITTI